MINVFVLDDEPIALQNVVSLIESNYADSLKIIGTATSIKTGLQFLNNSQEVDIAFLDIELQDGTSFELLEQLTSYNFKIVFITAYDAKAIEAIKLGALDYLLKPIDASEFAQTIKKIHKTRSSVNEEDTESLGKIFIKTAQSIHLVDRNDILYCKGEGNYTTFFLTNKKKIMVSKTLKDIEEMIHSSVFIRCHQSYLVNKKIVVEYSKSGHLILSNQLKIPVATRRKEATLKSLL